MITLNHKTVEVIKFKETGIVALCQEVADFVRSGEAQQRDLNIEHARFEDDGSCYKVVFDRLAT